jgi:phosphoglycolate phosphatase
VSLFTGVFFDLDGTLADTAPDLAFALNALLAEHGRAAMPFAAIRPHVSHGATALVRLGFAITPETPEFNPLRERLLEIYQANLVRESRLFPGMEAVLQTLERQNIKWGVVTNKPGWLTRPLLQQLGIHDRAATVVSGDSAARRKPDPEPMFLACREAGVAAEQCLYVGDAERDIEAGRRAGMRTLVALFGYIEANASPQSWGADGYIHEPTEILRWLTPQVP